MDRVPGPDHAAGDGSPIPARYRRWLYSVLVAAVPLLVVYGVLDESTAPLWIALGGSVLGHGLAAVNTPHDD